MGILNKPVREQTCLRLLLWFASQLMLPLRPRPRLTLVFFMEDMDMVDLDMLVSDMVVLDTLLLDMVVWAILVLAFMARDLLMLNPKPRLMLVSFMEDMDMVDLDMLDLDMLDLDMLVLDMVVLDMVVWAI